MRSMVRSAALAALIVLVVPAAASAQYREFSGRIDRISDEKVIVDNRMGDKVTFMKVKETVVQGEKDSWGKLKKDDWVTVSWKMMDKPRKAYIVKVTPAKEEAGEDVK
jgi:hypothetical protein